MVSRARKNSKRGGEKVSGMKAVCDAICNQGRMGDLEVGKVEKRDINRGEWQ